jgi:DNA-binding HxlR family transcriptional regulator
MGVGESGITTDQPGDPEMVRLIFQGKWRLPVLRQAACGPKRLSELQRLIPDASKKMLIDSLRSLEGLGWISRIDHGGKIRKVDYSIAPVYRRSIERALASIQKLSK